MSWRPDRYGALRRLVWGRRIDDEVADELEFHLQMRVEEFIAAGMRPDQARAEALERFGDRAAYERQTRIIEHQVERQGRRSAYVETARREVRQAMRALGRSPGFTVIAVVTLALGIGVTTALYAVLDAVVLRPLPYPEAERIVALESPVPGVGPETAWGLSQAGYFHFAREAKSLAAIGAFYTNDVNLVEESGAQRVRQASVTADLMRVLGAHPALGRLIQPADDTPDAIPVIVLGYDFWRTRLGADPGVLNSTIRINGREREVVGVMQEGINLPDRPIDIWMAFGLDPSSPPVNSHHLSALARLADGVTLESAQSELDRLTEQFPELFPGAYSATFMRETGFRTRAMSARNRVIGDVGRTLWILLVSVGLVLLIACANVANLFLVRSEARRREHAVRIALGADRLALAWHYATESMLLSLVAAGIGLLLAFYALEALLLIAPAGIPRLAEIGLSARSLLFAVGVALIAGVLFGLFPLLHRKVSPAALRESGRGLTASPRRQRVHSAIVVSQVALALVLLVASGLMLRSYAQLRAIDPGFDAENVLTFAISLPYTGYEDHVEVTQFYRELAERIQTLPGVVVAGAGTDLPTRGFRGCSSVFIEGKPLAPNENAPCLPNPAATPGYLAALGIPVRGRVPDWNEVQRGAPNVLVTEAFAQRFWPSEEAIGQGVVMSGDQPPYYRVVGVVRDFRGAGIDKPPVESILYPTVKPEGLNLWSPFRGMGVVVRTEGVDPLALVPAIRRELAEMDPTVPLYEVQTLEDVIARSPAVARASFTMILLAIAGIMALVLSAVGIYGVISYVVAQRRGEIGVRMALGARVAQVRTLIVTQSLRLAVIGVVIGILAALAATRLMRAMLFEVSPTDPLVLIGGPIVLILTAAVASYIPALRASRVDPTEALRSE